MIELVSVLMIWLLLGLALFMHMFAVIEIGGVMFLSMVWLMSGIFIMNSVVEIALDKFNK